MIKVKKYTVILKHLSKSLALKPFDQMYKDVGRSHLDYCDIIHYIPPIFKSTSLGMSLRSRMETVEKNQYQAGLSIAGYWKGTSHTKLYEELGWEALFDRRSMKHIFKSVKLHQRT